MRILSVNNSDNILNEEFAMAQGYSNNAVVNGFSYQIVPLTTNLAQKGNDPQPKMKNKAYKYFVGDMVKGICAYDNKKHKGMIKYIYYDEGKDYPKYTYIQDFQNNDTIPLFSNTVRKDIPPLPHEDPHMNYLDNRQGDIQDTIAGSRTIIESRFNFNIDQI